MFLFLLILNKSFPRKRIIKPTGVTIIKNTAPITIGDTIEPKRIPNLNHNLLNGVNNLEFKTPKTKKTKEKITDQILISSPYIKGHKPTIKKKMKKTKAKFRFEPIFILFINFVILYF